MTHLGGFQVTDKKIADFLTSNPIGNGIEIAVIFGNAQCGGIRFWPVIEGAECAMPPVVKR